MKKGLVFGIVVLFIGMSITPSTGTVIEKQIPIELIIDGPTDGKVGIPYDYTFYLIDPEECDLFLYVDWDDGDVVEWIGPYAPYEEVVLEHAWDECGIYTISAVATGCNGSHYYATLEVTITDNHPPDAPTIEGPLCGIVGVAYDYVFNAVDPDGDNVSYLIDWGDGTSDGWTNYYESGQDFTITHTWNKIDYFTIRCKAKDIYGAEGNWTDLIIYVSRNKAVQNTLFLRFLERFPLLERLLNLTLREVIT